MLRTDSIYIASNTTFENLAPLSTYLGKPGDPAKGGIPFEEYVRRQRLHRESEIAALSDTPLFIGKARDIYGYATFLCDTGGSVAAAADPYAAADPVPQSAAPPVSPPASRSSSPLARLLAASSPHSPTPTRGATTHRPR